MQSMKKKLFIYGLIISPILFYLCYFIFGIGHQRASWPLTSKEKKVENTCEFLFDNATLEFRHDFFAINENRQNGTFNVFINYTKEPNWNENYEEVKRKQILLKLIPILSNVKTYKHIFFYYEYESDPPNLKFSFKKKYTYKIIL